MSSLGSKDKVEPDLLQFQSVLAAGMVVDLQSISPSGVVSIRRIEMRGKKNTYTTEKKVAYREYLNSKAWRDKRKIVLARDGMKCRDCGCTDGLQVHHMWYSRTREEEVPSQLITLCRSCHEKRHRLKPAEERKAHSAAAKGEHLRKWHREKLYGKDYDKKPTPKGRKPLVLIKPAPHDVNAVAEILLEGV